MPARPARSGAAGTGSWLSDLTWIFSLEEDSATEVRSFPVRFEAPKQADILARTNRFDWVGTGRITVEPEAVVVEARRHRWFRRGVPMQVRFPRHAIHDVEREGRMLRFDVAEGHLDGLPVTRGEDVPLVTAWTDDEAAAAELQALLPPWRSEGFAPEAEQKADFEHRLHAVTPRIWVTPALVVINLGVFIAMVAGGADPLSAGSQHLIAWGSNFSVAVPAGETWRLVTHMFVHAGLIHLALNMVVLVAMGPLIERVFGSLRFLVIYLAAGLAGGLASVAWHSAVNSVGASGALFGILGALFAFMLDKDNDVPRAVVTKQRHAVGIFIAYSLLNGLGSGGIDNVAHIGGLACGFGLGWLLARPLDLPARSGRDTRGWAAVCAVMAACVVTLFPFDVQPSTAPAWVQRGHYYLANGKVEGAEAAFGQALALDHRRGDAYIYRSIAREKLGNTALAAEDFEETTRLLAGNAQAHNSLAWLLATAPLAGMRDGPRAIRLATIACELSQWRDPEYIDTLAAAYAEQGDFEEAIKWQVKALELFGGRAQKPERTRLELYRGHLPYRQE